VVDLDGLKEPLGLEQRLADWISGAWVEVGPWHHLDIRGRYGGSARGAFTVGAEFGTAVSVLVGSRVTVEDVIMSPGAE
jgi:hypothetical protein